MSLPKIQHMSLVDQVVKALLHYIEVEELRPGDRLPSTAELTRVFDVSRPVVREALKSLEGQGAIEIGNGRRAVVRPVSSDVLQSYFERALALDSDSILEILEVRHGIEVQGARLAAQRITPAQMAALRELVARMRNCLDEPERYTELDLQFHLLIAQASHNQLLYFLVESIRDILRDTIQEGLRHRLTKREREMVQITHEDIMEKLDARDAEGVAIAMAFHFTDAIRAIFYREEDTSDRG